MRKFCILVLMLAFSLAAAASPAIAGCSKSEEGQTTDETSTMDGSLYHLIRYRCTCQNWLKVLEMTMEENCPNKTLTTVYEASYESHWYSVFLGSRCAYALTSESSYSDFAKHELAAGSCDGRPPTPFDASCVRTNRWTTNTTTVEWLTKPRPHFETCRVKNEVGHTEAKPKYCSKKDPTQCGWEVKPIIDSSQDSGCLATCSTCNK